MRRLSGALLGALASAISLNSGREFHADSDETMVLVRQLEHIQEGLWSTDYQLPKVLSFVPRDTSIPAGATHFTWRQWDVVGMAAMISNYGKDLPRVDGFVTESTHKIQPLGAAYGYSYDDLRMAAMAQVQLDATKARAAKEAIDRLVDSLISIGDTSVNLTGFANNANVPRVTVTNGAWLTTNINNPDKVLADLMQLERTVISQSLDTHVPDTLILPLSHYAHVSSMPRSTNSDTTILEFFLKNSQGIKRVESWVRLSTTGTGGNPMAIAYKNTPEVVRGILPVPFEQMTPEVRNLEWLVNCLARCGGCVVYKPLAMLYGDGI